MRWCLFPIQPGLAHFDLATPGSKRRGPAHLQNWRSAAPDQEGKKFQPQMHTDAHRYSERLQGPWARRRISRRDLPKLSSRQNRRPVAFR